MKEIDIEFYNRQFKIVWERFLFEQCKREIKGFAPDWERAFLTGVGYEYHFLCDFLKIKR